jgi:S-DNA-T family DNA segregation ATPase FtsK/SpoIIIE
MSEKKTGQAHPDGTVVDLHLSQPRLKEGLVPPDTGLFLRIMEGQGAGRVFTFDSGGVFVVGRDGADISIDDPKISRKHAEVGLYGPSCYFVRDLASTNGTFLNGRRIRDRRELHHEDVIRVGDTVLQFSVIEDAVPVS